MMTRSADNPSSLFRQKSRFLSINGLVFYRALETAINGRAIICANVHLPKLVQPQKGLSAMEQRMHMEKVDKLHLDFVLCSPENFAVLGGIHTVDPGKPTFSELALRENLDEVCRSSGLPLFRIEYKDEYDIPKLQKQLESVLPNKEPKRVKNSHIAGIRSDNVSAEQSYIELPEATQPVKATPPPVAKPEKTKSGDQIVNAKPCPKCKSKLAVRTAKSGKNKGARYLVCTEYPICSFITVLKTGKPKT